MVDAKPLRRQVGWVCLKCGRPCSVTMPRKKEIREGKMGQPFLMDAKSKCCGADVRNFGSITCSKECHEEFVKGLEKEFGVYKKIVDANTGVAYAVPTRVIIERGIDHSELPAFPRWGEGGVA